MSYTVTTGVSTRAAAQKLLHNAAAHLNLTSHPNTEPPVTTQAPAVAMPTGHSTPINTGPAAAGGATGFDEDSVRNGHTGTKTPTDTPPSRHIRKSVDFSLTRTFDKIKRVRSSSLK